MRKRTTMRQRVMKVFLGNSMNHWTSTGYAPLNVELKEGLVCGERGAFAILS